MDISRRKFITNASKVAYAAPILTTVSISPTIAAAGSGGDFDQSASSSGNGKPKSNNGWHGNGNSNDGYTGTDNDTDAWDNSRRNNGNR